MGASQTLRIVCAISVLGFGSLASASDPDSDLAPSFTAIQAQDLAVPGSLSNAWADFDNDGDPDLAVSIRTGEVRLYRNDGGKLVSVGEAMGLPLSGSELRGLSWGDFDADGWVDLIGGPTSVAARSRLFRNQGGTGFVEVETPSPLTEAGRSSRQSNWVDFDQDGDLDFFAANRNGPNHLIRQDADGFRRIATDQPVSDPRPTVGACWFDYDQDGDLDLFLANQAGATDALWRNDGMVFVDVAPKLGMDRPGRRKEEGSVGCALADYDNDGDLDLYVASYGTAVLYRNDANGTFVDVAAELGLNENLHAVGAAWGDYDNDGYIDLFVAAYTGVSGNLRPDDRLYRNLAGQGFKNILAPGSVMNVADHGVQWVDVDGDGALDLSVTRAHLEEGGHFIFHNDLGKQLRRRHLSVLVLDRNGHATRMGAEVRLFNRGGRLLATRQVSTGEGYNSQSVLPVHFGLASKGPVTVEVTYFAAGRRVTQRYRRVDPARLPGGLLRVHERDDQ